LKKSLDQFVRQTYELSAATNVPAVSRTSGNPYHRAAASIDPSG
jgi:hypothetical protein